MRSAGWAVGAMFGGVEDGLGLWGRGSSADYADYADLKILGTEWWFAGWSVAGDWMMCSFSWVDER